VNALIHLGRLAAAPPIGYDVPMKRRDLLDWMAMGAAVASMPTVTGCDLAREAADGDVPRPRNQGTTHIGMLIYPNFTALDLIGPQTIFSMMTDTKVHLVWKTIEPVTSDSGITITPTATFATCPQDLGVLFVPGGTFGTVAMMEDEEVLEFLRSRAATAGLVTSVCTGSLVLGAAGLLRDRYATTHWVAREVLSVLEANPVAERYVADGNRITGAGITAGIDFGLRIAALLRNDSQAQVIQLNLEYDPEPPYPGGGSPDTASPAAVATLETRYEPFLAAAIAAAEAAAAKFP
jgi:cyclohexyl-isocyanide hydratase